MRSRWIIAAVLALVGIVWIGQGTGVIRGSGFMTDDIRWAIVGRGAPRGRCRRGVDGRQVPPEDLSQPAQVASARPTVTS